MIGTIVFYGFLALIAYGGFWELRENAKKERKRAPNGGKARGRYQKRLRQYAASVPTSAPVSNTEKPRRAHARQKPLGCDAPLYLQDVESALKNLGYSKTESKRAMQNASCDGFESRFKDALAQLRSAGVS